MPEDAPSKPEANDLAEHRNLPVPLSRPETGPGDNGESWLHRLLRGLFGRSGSTRSDIEVLLEDHTLADTGFSLEQLAMLKNILGLSERRVEDIMVPRAHIVSVHQDIPLGELMKVFEKAGHSRLVVYDDTLDDPVGLVHIRDLIGYMTAQAAVSAQSKIKRKKPLPADLDLGAIDLATPLSQSKIVRTILFVPPSMPTLDLLAKMQATRIHLALVIDEYGGTDGLVSIEDLVEQIVGEIEDEHDTDEEPDLTLLPDGGFEADARVAIEDLEKAADVRLTLDGEPPEMDTLGAYIAAMAGRVPQAGEVLRHPCGLDFEVAEADPRRVRRVRVRRSVQPEPETSAAL